MSERVIVTVQIDEPTRRAVANHEALAGRLPAAAGYAVGQAASVGADAIAELLIRGELGITSQHGGAGLAGAVTWWWIDEPSGVAAVGVPSNSASIRYALALEEGRHITPKTAKRLAVPISAEAKRYSSPRDMEGLELLPREGKAPLLVRQLAKGAGGDPLLEVHWVLLASVELPRFAWFSTGGRLAEGAISEAFADGMAEYVATFNAGAALRGGE